MRFFRYLFFICLIMVLFHVGIAGAHPKYTKTTDLPASTVPVASSTTIMDIGAGTFKVALSDIYASVANIGAPTIVTTGPLDTGSITSGFGTINNGASTITSSVDITGGTHAATADTAAGDNSSLGYTTSEGAIITGQGTTNDVTIKNDADAEVAGVPTGTTNLSMPAGTVIIADGGTVTQATDKSTGVTLSTYSGQITTNNASLAAGAEVTFTVTNTIVTALDVVCVSIASSPDADSEVIAYVNRVASGAYDIVLSNLSAAADTGAIVINVVVLRGASS